ncbi:MAG: xanthine dehydrogenase family protein molybdopterin-binding subunit [Actinomycetota bacterium]|jgi:CO/xanthine dehydrogenase Mo-binding subunit|nr:xanthine dehydrogenase family protein molybdopterin-binding subunit [Actinomycetota bacterium]
MSERRIDAVAKATGAAKYTADVVLEGTTFAAVKRSDLPSALIEEIDISPAKEVDGVLGVFTAKDLPGGANLYGRRVFDVPILADGRVRRVGDPIAAVVATSREIAEAAAELIEVTYKELTTVATAREAIQPDSPLIHDRPWEYAGAVVTPDSGRNIQSVDSHGSREAAESALRNAVHVIDETYFTPGDHQGYIEPQACIADYHADGSLNVWNTNKSPYRLRDVLSSVFGLDPKKVEIMPTVLGGDFGGKGSPGDAPLCTALSILVGRPVKMVLRYSDDLLSTDGRHSSEIRVRLGIDASGKLVGGIAEALLDGGAYAGFKPVNTVNLHGIVDAAIAYRIPEFFVESKIVYTNNQPKGHMRAPGSPQAAFAFESALDELGRRSGIGPIKIRELNLLSDGDVNPYGSVWLEYRGKEVLSLAMSQPKSVDVPEGWLHGEGVAIYARSMAAVPKTSLRLRRGENGKVIAEVPIPENGAGGQTVVREMIRTGLGISADKIEVNQVSTSLLPTDAGVGGSRVSLGVTVAVANAIKLWKEMPADQEVVEITTDEGSDGPSGAYSAQLARVAVDPMTGQLKVLELISAVDVAEIVNPKAHQMQIDGGAVMGFGFAVMEDLLEEGGQPWALSMGEFKLPNVADIPKLTTALLRGGKGVGPNNIKAVGELTNCPTGAAIANAVEDATGVRIRRLPIRAETIYWGMKEGSAK